MIGKELVKAGYNAIAAEYLASRAEDSEDVRLLQDLIRQLPEGAKVLDAGCGAVYWATEFLEREAMQELVGFRRLRERLAQLREGRLLVEPSRIFGQARCLPH